MKRQLLILSVSLCAILVLVCAAAFVLLTRTMRVPARDAIGITIYTLFICCAAFGRSQYRLVLEKQFGFRMTWEAKQGDLKLLGCAGVVCLAAIIWFGALFILRSFFHGQWWFLWCIMFPTILILYPFLRSRVLRYMGRGRYILKGDDPQNKIRPHALKASILLSLISFVIVDMILAGLYEAFEVRQIVIGTILIAIGLGSVFVLIQAVNWVTAGPDKSIFESATSRIKL